MNRVGARRILAGLAVASGGFLLLGTVAALWPNPLFVRMTPAGGWEIGLLAVTALLGGAWVAIRRPFCPTKGAGAGGILTFLGIACPVCNKILLLIFGGELLMAWYEPVRLYVALAGALIMAAVTVLEWRAAGRYSW